MIYVSHGGENVQAATLQTNYQIISDSTQRSPLRHTIQNIRSRTQHCHCPLQECTEIHETNLDSSQEYAP